MQYDLNQLGDPTKFQRLLNAILTARFGEDARLTPLRGPDGGSDGETAPGNPHLEFQYAANPSSQGQSLLTPPRRGRYLFQAKYHQTGEHRLSDLRTRVVQDFARELDTAVLGRADLSSGAWESVGWAGVWEGGARTEEDGGWARGGEGTGAAGRGEGSGGTGDVCDGGREQGGGVHEGDGGVQGYAVV